MPWKVVKKSGPRPYKIIKATMGKVVGSSLSKQMALASVRARYSAEGKK